MPPIEIAPFGDQAIIGADNGMPMAPGLFVNAEIDGRTIDNVVKIPRSALRGVDQVYVGDGPEGRLEIRTVDVAFSSDDGAFLRSGVEPGELAIVSPIQAAFDGMSIEVVERMPDGSLESRTPRKKAGGDEDEASDAPQVAGETEGATQ